MNTSYINWTFPAGHLFLSPSFCWGGWTTACVCSQPPCRRAGPKSGVATAVKGSGPLTLETGHSRSPPPPQWAPQTDEPPRAAPATPAKDHPYAVPRDSSDEGGSGPERRCRAGERLQRREPGQKTKRDANAASARDYRPKAAIPLTDPPWQRPPRGAVPRCRCVYSPARPTERAEISAVKTRTSNTYAVR